MKKLLILLVACFSLISAQAAYLRDIPVTVNQPDGTVLQCFASGDEYFNYLHDKDGYTIMQHPETGYYVYADKIDGKLVATNIIAGRENPASKGLNPYNLISPEEWMARREAWREPEKEVKNRDGEPNHGTLNNIAIFLRFSDDAELTNSYNSIDNMFNDVSDGAISLRSYFRAASYNNIEIPTTFYPGHNGNTVISYQDTYPRSYFKPYNASTNPNGYQNDNQRTEREHSLLKRAVDYINANYPIPTTLNIDYDNDGYVDNVCFIVKGNVGGWNDLLWPHKWSLYTYNATIHGKRVWTYNFQLADASSYFNTSTMCHEMNHSLSAPDLYHYYNGTSLSPVGRWDLMENNQTPPQHCGAYMKMKYGHWVNEIPEITQPGIYTLNPVSSATPTNIAYKIASTDPNQFYVLEYRDNTSLFETSLPGSGLLIYRIDTRYEGNAYYDPSSDVYDEVYLFRPNGSTTANGTINSAYFSASSGRTEFNASTNPHPFLTDGTIDNDLRIYDISAAGSTITFSVGAPSSICQPPTNVTAVANNDVVNLSWTAAANAQSYNVFRNGSFIGNISGTTYTDHDMSFGVYSYFLKSVDVYGLQSNASETVSVSVMPDNYIYIGDDGTNNSVVLPSYSFYNYSLSEQIYTSAELGGAGTIYSIAFYNEGDTKTRDLDLYLTTTTKNSFSSGSDWVAMASSDKVFSGSVTMTANEWTTITLNTPFVYNGTSNLILTTDDNSGSWTSQPHMSCRVFNATSKAIYAFNDDTNYNPLSPSSYSGTVSSVKNQIVLFKASSTLSYTITASASPNEGGTVSGGGTYTHGASCTLTATPNSGYTFNNWTKNGTVVSTNASYTFTVTADGAYVANFSETPTILQVSAEYYPDANDPESQYVKVSWTEVSEGERSTYKVYRATCDGTLQLVIATGVTANQYIDDGWENLTPGYYQYGVNISDGGTNTIFWSTCIEKPAPIEEYQITTEANPAEGGTVSGANTYFIGSQCTLTAMSSTGYNFTNWTKNGAVVSTNASYTFIVTEEAHYVANFNLKTYTVSVSANPAAGGVVTGGGTYSHGATATVEVTPNTNYTFDYWTLNGTTVSEEPQYSFVVTGNRQLVAHLTNHEGVDENDASTLSVYPNPAQDKINLRGTAMQSVKVHNTMGQLVIAKEYGNADNVELDLNGLVPGIYTITVRMTDGSIAKKMIIKARN